MSKDLIDILIEKREREDKFFKNYLYYAKEIKEEAQKILNPIKVFVFGSILRKDEIPNDIDILIISPKLRTNEEKTKVRVKIWKKIGMSSPFEIHLITPEDFRDWYSHFIKEEKVEI